MAFWAIWFNSYHEGVREIVDGVATFIIAYKIEVGSFDTVLNSKASEEDIRWTPLEVDEVKVNFDASYCNQSRKTIT